MTAAADVARAHAHLYADATRVLDAYAPAEPAQEELRRAYLTFLASHPDGVAKAGPPEHLTASCLVLDRSGTRVLLTLHRRARRWFQFGGHLEAGDATLRAAAAREAREESGIAGLEPLPDPVQLDRHVLDGDFARCREHLDVRYAALAPDGAEPRVSAESLDVRWWPVADLPPGTAGELSGLVEASRVALGLLGRG
ncbi:NUDIX hydrolase [Phycicoccus flavus]|uniref:NUDIX hydrolase n=1 Tax=Phycicoccus flavus TaxID=2502783 RepID=UPI000FEB6187|nr:NUDIX domain-containing protein [Phycicoccus flavus]NHA66906.1 NUDIX domain-containing protein [Phycicoccus flavus]